MRNDRSQATNSQQPNQKQLPQLQPLSLVQLNGVADAAIIVRDPPNTDNGP